MTENIELVRAKWQSCSACGSILVLVTLDYQGECLCYECIVEGMRFEPGDRGESSQAG